MVEQVTGVGLLECIKPYTAELLLRLIVIFRWIAKSIHCREAYEDLINILREYRLDAVPGVVHCFSGNKEQATTLIEMGFSLGIGGMFTRLPCNSETVCAIKELPLEKIVLETILEHTRRLYPQVA